MTCSRSSWVIGSVPAYARLESLYMTPLEGPSFSADFSDIQIT
jgi:hypothetical protein